MAGTKRTGGRVQKMGQGNQKSSLLASVTMQWHKQGRGCMGYLKSALSAKGQSSHREGGAGHVLRPSLPCPLPTVLA